MKYIKLFILVAIGVLTFGCDNITDLNENVKDPAVAPAETLFSNAQKNFIDHMTSINVNINVFRLYAQQISQCTYPQESQYVMDVRNIPDFWWDRMYRDVLKDLDEADKVERETTPITEEQTAEQNNRLAIYDIHRVFAYQSLVDVFGDVPYSQALDIDNLLPVYDDAKAVYTSLIADLQASLSSMNETYGSSLGSADPVFDGDVAAWKKFGNSLLLRLAMRMSDDDSGAAKQIAESVASNVMTSNADNAYYPYIPGAPNYNILYEDLVASGRKDFVGSNTMIDMMNSLNDGRIGKYFELASDGTYKGGTYGDANSYSANSPLSNSLHTQDFHGMLLSYCEVEFLLAEAVERGYNVGGTAEEHYNAGIMASFDEWGAEGAADYMAQASVAYSTAPGDWKQKIGTQKWLALFNKGLEAWTEWRRLDQPTLNPPPGMTNADIPRRMIYPINEATLNGGNYDAAAAKYSNDAASAKIFWDKN